MKQKYSATTRILCGVLGMLGVAAIAFGAVRGEGIHPSFLLFAKLFAGFIFLYVAIFGTNPLGIGSQNDSDGRL